MKKSVKKTSKKAKWIVYLICFFIILVLIPIVFIYVNTYIHNQLATSTSQELRHYADSIVISKNLYGLPRYSVTSKSDDLDGSGPTVLGLNYSTANNQTEKELNSTIGQSLKTAGWIQSYKDEYDYYYKHITKKIDSQKCIEANIEPYYGDIDVVASTPVESFSIQLNATKCPDEDS